MNRNKTADLIRICQAYGRTIDLLVGPWEEHGLSRKASDCTPPIMKNKKDQLSHGQLV